MYDRTYRFVFCLSLIFPSSSNEILATNAVTSFTNTGTHSLTHFPPSPRQHSQGQSPKLYPITAVPSFTIITTRTYLIYHSKNAPRQTSIIPPVSTHHCSSNTFKISKTEMLQMYQIMTLAHICEPKK